MCNINKKTENNMNTIRKISIALLGCMLLATSVVAQTFHYNTTRTFREVGFTYQANVSHGMVRLFNANNRHNFDREQTWRDGRMITIEDTRRFPSTVEPCVLTAREPVRNIVRNAMSPAERQRMGDRQLMVQMLVNQNATTPQPITEVQFTFSNTSPFATLPVSVFRQIELEIKRQIRFMPNAHGRNLNFVMVGFPVRVN